MRNHKHSHPYLLISTIGVMLIAIILIINQAFARQAPVSGRQQDSLQATLSPEPGLSAYPQPGVTMTVLYPPSVLGIVVDVKSSTIVHIEPGSAAERAGLQINDRFLEWNKVPLANYATEDELWKLKAEIDVSAKAIDASAKAQPTMLIERDGTKLEVAITPSLMPKLSVESGSSKIPPTVTPVVLPYWYF